MRLEKPWAEHFSLRFFQCVVELILGAHLVASITSYGCVSLARRLLRVFCFEPWSTGTINVTPQTFAVIPFVCRLYSNSVCQCFLFVFLPPRQSCQTKFKVPTRVCGFAILSFVSPRFFQSFLLALLAIPDTALFPCKKPPFHSPKRANEAKIGTFKRFWKVQFQ